MSFKIDVRKSSGYGLYLKTNEIKLEYCFFWSEFKFSKMEKVKGEIIFQKGK